jgi:hypothetical protein
VSCAVLLGRGDAAAEGELDAPVEGLALEQAAVKTAIARTAARAGVRRLMEPPG